MKNVTDTTEYKALCIIARMVKNFEKLHFLTITEKDASALSYARDLLERIIHTNGYTVNYNRKRNRVLLKTKLKP
ncbi:hypothetical protein [Chryseobacterium herbae]|uniref:Uncharacterized protein n=1 Tax=Chryseobacterium herbae TaxID=2976476 RepID=A0ABT2ISP1_9FLAO|nr:hypothetical protein [Chryseobacterium sp. pc1-10]MCT2561846.1 hypothetical protein [Chryseobacterium sp. pc1-10]